VQAVVMAAGEGRRLRPITERWPKPLLPVDGRPVLATLLRALAEAGCARIVVVTGHLADQVEELVGDGSGFGVEVVYARQPRPDGSADAVRVALDAGAEPPLVVAGADTVFGGGDVRRFAEAFAASGAAGAIAVRRRPPPSPPHRFAVRVREGRVEQVLDDDPENPLAGAPLWSVGAPVAARIREVVGASGGPPYELARAFQLAVDAGEQIAGIEIGRTRDLTDPLDLVKENFPYLGS
jgi:NDP-sugar pyrophosphorylase family protein